MREVILDTETTGLDPKTGDRLIEIGCIEIFNRNPTGREFHAFINPERDVPESAVRIHGLTAEFLRDKPLFASVANDFLAFIGDDPLVIHNASFDVGFLNFELERVNLPTISFDRVVDTLALARRKHPGTQNTLDALCKRYGIDNSERIKHGALVDSLLLAEVYVALLGERQGSLGLQSAARQLSGASGAERGRGKARQRAVPLPPRLTEHDIAQHRAFIETMKAKAIWLNYWPEKPS